MKRVVLFAAFVACVVGANWALNRWGIVELPFTSLAAPAGAYFAGLTFGVRDALHEVGGKRWVVAAIGVGATVSYLLDDAVRIPGGHVAIAVASATAFLVSETCDLLVYEPLRRRAETVTVTLYTDGGYAWDVGALDKRWWVGAVAASNLVGAVVDSALFLWLAFGSLDHIEGQVVGKALMILPALVLVGGVRRAVLPRNAYA